MPSESLLLGNVLEFKNGKNHPGLDQYEQYDVYGANGPIGKTSDFNTEGDTIVIGRVGSYCGSLHFSTEKGWVTDNAIAAKALKPIETKFWFYALQSMGLERWRAGSGQPLITQSTLKSLLAPNVEPQDRLPIAGVLGALDDLIDTNQELAENCDALAGSVFQRHITDGPLRYEKLANLAEIALGCTPSRKIDDYWNGDIPWLNSGVANQFRVLSAEEHITNQGLQRSSAKIFPAGSTLLAITGATLGQISRTEIEACGNQSLIAISGESSALNDWIFLAMRDSIGRLTSHATGAAQQHINKQNVIDFEIPVLSADALEGFGKLVSPLFDSVKDLLLEAEQMRSSRDELLPLLMSGKIRVREAEEVVASVTKESA